MLKDTVEKQRQMIAGVGSTKKTGAAEEPRGLSSEIMLVNPTLATNLLESTRFERQRNINETNVRRLAGEMSRGWYIDGTPLFFCVLPDGKMYLVNGSHSLNAVVHSGVSLEFTAIYRPCQNLDEVGHIYSRFDIHRQRSWNDAFKAAGMSEITTFDTSWQARFGSALRAILTRFECSTNQVEIIDLLQSREMQLRIFEHYISHAEAYIGSLAHKHGNRSLIWRRASVMAVGLELFRYQPKKAHDFFYYTSLDHKMSRTDPRKMLFEYLREHPNFVIADRRAAAYAVTQAWNAFYGDYEITVISPKSIKEVQIRGTPWKKGYQPFSDMVVPTTVTKHGLSYKSFETGEHHTKTGIRPVSNFGRTNA